MNKLFSITALLAMFFMFGATDLNAQKELKEGSIVMELTEIKSDDPAMAGQLSMLKGSSNTVYFNAEKILTKMEMMGGMMEMSIIADAETQEGFMLFNIDMLGKKSKINLDKEAIANQKEQASASDLTVTYDKSDTKVIAGYNCYKANFTSPQLGGTEMSAYITQEIKIKANIIQGVPADLIDGFPLEYSIGAPGMTMVYTTIEIKDTVDNSVFNLDTAGYEEQTMEEFTKEMGAMGGGMGF